jgi:hypothetical protein
MSSQLQFPNNPIEWYSQPRDLTGENTNLGIYTNDDTQRYSIGTLHETWDGKKFRYNQVGAANVAAGLMQASGVDTAKHIAIAQTGYAQVAGSTKVRCLVTTGGIAAGETFAQINALAGGSVSWYTDGTPSSLVQSNDVVSSVMISETIIELELATPIRRAVAATEYVILTPNKYFKTIVMPATTATSQAVGVAVTPLTAAYFGWLQTKGPCAMQVDTGDTMTIGALAGIPATDAIAGTAGAATSTLYAFPIYGRVLQLGAADKYAIIDLMLE